MKNENKIIVLDIETTGFLGAGGKIVEVGMVSLDVKTGEIEQLFHSIFKEPGLTGKDRDAWIFKNSNLTVGEVREAPMLSDLLPEIQCILDAYPLGATAFNRSFDMSFLADRGIKFVKLQPCPMLLLTPIMKLKKRGGGNKWPKVEEAIEKYCLIEDYTEAHRGLEDATDEAGIIWKMIEQGHYDLV